MRRVKVRCHFDLLRHVNFSFMCLHDTFTVFQFALFGFQCLLSLLGSKLAVESSKMLSSSV